MVEGMISRRPVPLDSSITLPNQTDTHTPLGTSRLSTCHSELRYTASGPRT